MTWPAYMRIETLARYLDQSVRYVEQLERRGLLPPRRPLLMQTPAQRGSL